MTIFDEAIKLAVNAHSGQTRKTDSSPYILHPMEVAAIVGDMTDDLDVLAAAVLHDAVEDTSISVDEIGSKLGERVAQLVDAETEDKRDGRAPEDTWKARKEESLRVLAASTDRDVKILWLGDKLANLSAIHRAWAKDGDAVWQKFHQHDPKEQGWYYRSVADLLQADLGDTPAWKQYDRLIRTMFEGGA